MNLTYQTEDKREAVDDDVRENKRPPLTITRYQSGERYPVSLCQQWGDWLNNFRWTTFGTFTTKNPVSEVVIVNVLDKI